MTRPERLCRYLLGENPLYSDVTVPDDIGEQRKLLRALMNVRPPVPATEEFLQLQDEELQEQLSQKVVTTIGREGLIEWQGDITALKVDAIVNAANSRMLGCFIPHHRCIDNAIHSAAGVQLRLFCNDLMQGREEPTGRAILTPGFNLPARYILHTVGPVVTTPKPLPQQEAQLASCYRSCMDLAAENSLESIAFCCISTGEFHFPNDLACRIAVGTVRNYLKTHPDSSIKTVVFNTFKDIDHVLYQEALTES